MELPEATLKSFDKFVKEGYFTLFMSEEMINTIREKFKKDFNLEE